MKLMYINGRANVMLAADWRDRGLFELFHLTNETD